MTLTIDDVLNEIITDVGADPTDADFKTKMLGFLKSGIRHVPAIIRSRLFIALGTKTLAVGGSSVDLATLSPGFIKERAVWVVTSENKRQPILRANSNNSFNLDFTPNSLGDPRIYRIYAKTMEFNRSADVEKTIGIEYFKEVSGIETGDTFFGDDSMLACVKHFAKMVYYGDYEEDEPKQNRHERQGLRLASEAEGDYEAQEMGGHVEHTE